MSSKQLMSDCIGSCAARWQLGAHDLPVHLGLSSCGRTFSWPASSWAICMDSTTSGCQHGADSLPRSGDPHSILAQQTAPQQSKSGILVTQTQ